MIYQGKWKSEKKLFLECKNEKCSKRKVPALATKIWIQFLKIDFGFKNIMLLCCFCIFFIINKAKLLKTKVFIEWCVWNKWSHGDLHWYYDTESFWQYSFNIQMIQIPKFANSNICFNAVCVFAKLIWISPPAIHLIVLIRLL